jgi:hypothetical protein
MPVQNEADLVSRRAELLAQVTLTRQLNVTLHSWDALDQGLDFIGTLHDQKDNEVFRPFGVVVWGTARPLETEKELTEFANARIKKLNTTKYFLPVIVLAFSMQKDEGYFEWLMEPSPDGTNLSRVSKPKFKPCNVKELQMVLQRIEGWYSRLESMILKPK